jgi:hypothetical protein
MSKSKELISKIQRAFADAEITARVQPLDTKTKDGYFEILVPEAEAQTAHMKLIQLSL